MARRLKNPDVKVQIWYDQERAQDAGLARSLLGRQVQVDLRELVDDGLVGAAGAGGPDVVMMLRSDGRARCDGATDRGRVAACALVEALRAAGRLRGLGLGTPPVESRFSTMVNAVAEMMVTSGEEQANTRSDKLLGQMLAWLSAELGHDARLLGGAMSWLYQLAERSLETGLSHEVPGAMLRMSRFMDRYERDHPPGPEPWSKALSDFDLVSFLETLPGDWTWDSPRVGAATRESDGAFVNVFDGEVRVYVPGLLDGPSRDADSEVFQVVSAVLARTRRLAGEGEFGKEASDDSGADPGGAS